MLIHSRPRYSILTQQAPSWVVMLIQQTSTWGLLSSGSYLGGQVHAQQASTGGVMPNRILPEDPCGYTGSLFSRRLLWDPGWPITALTLGATLTYNRAVCWDPCWLTTGPYFGIHADIKEDGTLGSTLTYSSSLLWDPRWHTIGPDLRIRADTQQAKILGHMGKYLRPPPSPFLLPFPPPPHLRIFAAHRKIAWEFKPTHNYIQLYISLSLPQDHCK